MMQAIGIYGGSFNPIHLGHLNKIIKLNQLCHFDRLFFLPCGQHALKDTANIAIAHRLEMLNIALANHPFEIDTQELTRAGISYTIDTLKNYRKQYGRDTSLSFIMGHDAFADFTRWKSFDSILSLAHIILLSRPIHHHAFNQTLSDYLIRHQTPNLDLLHLTSCGSIFNIETSNYPYASSSIRTAIQQQHKPLGLDPQVAAYIEQYQLYR